MITNIGDFPWKLTQNMRCVYISIEDIKEYFDKYEKQYYSSTHNFYAKMEFVRYYSFRPLKFYELLTEDEIRDTEYYRKFK